MGSRKTDNYIREAKLFLGELAAYLKTEGVATIKEIATELDKDRNYVSAFVSACVAFDFCDIKVSNSKLVSLTESGKKYSSGKTKFIITTVKKDN
ncbi:MAG: hypothetical protein ACTSRG_17910 [Candidatus Helarchaeota archaeon]